MQLELQIVDLPWDTLFCASLLLPLRLLLLIVCESFAQILPGTNFFFILNFNCTNLTFFTFDTIRLAYKKIELKYIF